MQKETKTDEVKVKKERKPIIRDGLFRLYKEIETEEGKALIEIGSYLNEVDVKTDYKLMMDRGVSTDQLKGFKSRLLEFTVKPAETKITVK